MGRRRCRGRYPQPVRGVDLRERVCSRVGKLMSVPFILQISSTLGHAVTGAAFSLLVKICAVFFFFVRVTFSFQTVERKNAVSRRKKQFTCYFIRTVFIMEHSAGAGFPVLIPT